MSNEKCGPCSESDHANCVWSAGLCPVCGPDGCLTKDVLPIPAWTPDPGLGDVVLRNRTEPENRAKARRAVGFAAAQLERDIAQDEALRGLLSYCETRVEEESEESVLAYADVANKLKGILDGER